MFNYFLRLYLICDLSIKVHYVIACKFVVLASVRFAERGEAEWSNHTSQNNIYKQLRTIFYMLAGCKRVFPATRRDVNAIYIPLACKIYNSEFRQITSNHLMMKIHYLC